MTITSELEAVARAICIQSSKYLLDNGISDKDFSTLMDDRWKLFTKHARSALLAIREPTEAMLEAVDTSNPDGSNYVEDEWQAMIDHILGAKP